MARSRSPVRGVPKARKAFLVQKPSGQLSARVQAVGAARFGIVACDCAKARSRLFFADFLGNVLIEPFTLEHRQADFQEAFARIRRVAAQHGIRDLIVAIERTGDYHQPVRRAFQEAGFDTRIVHPFTSKQYRMPLDPDQKTDDTDLAAIFRAAAQGFALLENTLPEPYLSLQLLRRQRRDLVDKAASLQCQIRETLHAVMPGFEKCFCHLWDSPSALAVFRRIASAQGILQLGFDGLRAMLRELGIAPQAAVLQRMLEWARQAPPPHPLLDLHRDALVRLDDDRVEKTRQIEAIERRLAALVVRTPYALLMALPGVNVVTCADLAGEMGPVAFYAEPACITGRAGLFPRRSQSDQVHRPNGSLARRANRRLRAVLMQTASNLLLKNNYYQAKARVWALKNPDPRSLRVKIAKAFSRMLFAVVAGGMLPGSDAFRPKQYLMGKLLKFHLERKTPAEQVRQDLDRLADLLPAKARAQEAAPLQAELDKLARKRGPQPLADLLPLVLARLAERSRTSGTDADDPTSVDPTSVDPTSVDPTLAASVESDAREGGASR